MGEELVRLTVVLPSELDQRFRDALYTEKRVKKGDISEAVAEALELWLAQRKGKVADRR